MNFLNINYFLVIAEEGSISAASRKLYISQQSLSEHLKKMESELGASLFNRETPLTLTPAGQCFYEGSKELLNVYRKTLANIDEVTGKQNRNLTIGIPTYCEPPFLSDLLMAFHQKYPEYNITVSKRQHADIAHNFNGVNLYISYLPLSDELEHFILLDPDPYCVTFLESLGRKIYKNQWEEIKCRLEATQDLSLLKEMPFLILRDRHNQISQDLSDIFNEYHFEPIIGFNSENGELNDKLCLNGIGCLLATQDYVRRRFFHYENGGAPQLCSYPIKVTSFEPKQAISFEKKKVLQTAEKYFLQEAAAFFKKG